ncbi:hypothetical protein PRIPAC_92381, partial [Pristionchus pacificus]
VSRIKSLDDLLNQNRELAQTIERMRKEFEEMENAHAITVQAQFERIDELNKRNDELFERSSQLVKHRSNNKAVVDESKKIQLENELLKKQLKEKDSKITELNLRNKALTANNEKLSKENENALPLAEANEKLKRELITAKQEIINHKYELQQLKIVLRAETEQHEQTAHEAREQAKKIGNGAFYDLMDQCSCAVCCEVFASAGAIPRVLDCGHTFCEICIGKLSNNSMFNSSRITCPSCNAHTSMPHGKVLHTNFFAISIVEEAMKAVNNQRATCEVCENLIIESDNPEGSKKDEIPVADEVMEAMEEEG